MLRERLSPVIISSHVRQQAGCSCKTSSWANTQRSSWLGASRCQSIVGCFLEAKRYQYRTFRPGSGSEWTFMSWHPKASSFLNKSVIVEKWSKHTTVWSEFANQRLTTWSFGSVSPNSRRSTPAVHSPNFSRAIRNIQKVPKGTIQQIEINNCDQGGVNSCSELHNKRRRPI